MAVLEPCFLKSHNRARADHRPVLNGIAFVNRDGLRRRNALKDYGGTKGGSSTKLLAMTETMDFA